MKCGKCHITGRFDIISTEFSKLLMKFNPLRIGWKLEIKLLGEMTQRDYMKYY